MPNGQAAVYAFYGWDPAAYLLPDMHPRLAWEVQMGPAAFPEPLPIAGMPGLHASSARVHRKILPYVEQTFAAIHAAGLWHAMAPWGGAYNFRLKRNGTGLSMHALGCAFDLDPEHNPMREGIVSDLVGELRGLALVQALRDAAKVKPLPFALSLDLARLLVQLGWTWGAEFSDVMHWQWARSI
jgi:hypothetical protein